MEITHHPLFDEVDWRTLADRKAPILDYLRMLSYSCISEVAPDGLHLPQFTHAEPKIAPNTGAAGNVPPAQYEESLSQGFPFSAFFQPSSSVSPGLSIIRPNPDPTSACGLGNGNVSNGVLRSSLSSATFDSTSSASSFIGFSWGPLSDAFPPAVHTGSADPEHEIENRNTPNLIPLPTNGTPAAGLYHNSLLVPIPGPPGGGILSTPRPFAKRPP